MLKKTRVKSQESRVKSQEPSEPQNFLTSEPQNFLTSEQTAGFSEPQNLKTKSQGSRDKRG